MRRLIFAFVLLAGCSDDPEFTNLAGDWAGDDNKIRVAFRLTYDPAKKEYCTATAGYFFEVAEGAEYQIDQASTCGYSFFSGSFNKSVYLSHSAGFVELSNVTANQDLTIIRAQAITYNIDGSQHTHPGLAFSRLK